MEYPRYKKILFCTDFSENSDHAFWFAYGIAKRDEGTLYLLHVIPENPHQPFVKSYTTEETYVKIEKGIEEDVYQKFREHYEKHIEPDIKFKTTTESARTDDGILSFAKKEAVDIIVIGTHGRTGIEHVFFGSVAEKVIQNSPFPVFVIPCKKKMET